MSSAADAVARAGSTWRTQAFIDGDYVASCSGETFTTSNPATGEVLAEVEACDALDADRAVGAARRAFESDGWSEQSPRDRRAVLLRFADVLEEHAEELALLDTLDAGKPISDCRSIDVPESVKVIRWYAEAIDKLYDSIAPTDRQTLGLVLREPIGVIAAVLPWNFPLMMAIWKLAPALAAGNAIILKPAELTPLSTLKLGELASEAGIPDGVVNVLPGLGETVGAALGRHADIDAVTFTGSTEVGRLFLQYAAESNLKRVTLECGGKSPQIVMADVADLERVADHAATAAFWNAGQNCTCGSRLIVHRSAAPELLERVKERSHEWRVGDPLDEATRLGPLIEEAHFDKVMELITSGTAEGATLDLGGVQAGIGSGGYFIPPTIFSDVEPHMRIAAEEIFGPVVSTFTFDTVDEAVQIANNTVYGLAASLWTDDLSTAITVSRKIRAGTVSVNCYAEGDVTTPFGGYKESGFGGRDNGLQAFDQYTEYKTVWIDASAAAST